MTIRPLSRDEVRSIDARAAEELGMPTVILMENAGRGAAAWIRDVGVPAAARVLILCGPGNNGGDGGVVARHLDLWGYSVRVVWFARADRLRGDAAVQFQILARAGFDQSCWDDEPSVTPERLDTLLAGADWVVDALLGTGLTRPVEGVLRLVIEAMQPFGQADPRPRSPLGPRRRHRPPARRGDPRAGDRHLRRPQARLRRGRGRHLHRHRHGRRHRRPPRDPGTVPGGRVTDDRPGPLGGARSQRIVGPAPEHGRPGRQHSIKACDRHDVQLSNCSRRACRSSSCSRCSRPSSWRSCSRSTPGSWCSSPCRRWCRSSCNPSRSSRTCTCPS